MNASGSAKARVLVVDDSVSMRMMFSDLLEQIQGIEVTGIAASADEAREKINELRPDVLTLDIDMPGTNGLEFLEEIMSKRPMPVIILSALAQKGSAMAKKAMDLGAVSCFGKPITADSAKFAKEIKRLGELVHEAHAIDMHKHVEALRAKGTRCDS